MKLTTLVHPAEEGGFWAEVPALPGCVSEGETLEETLANIREAAEGWLEVAAERVTAGRARGVQTQLLEIEL
ncbi:MAG: type II toxin-antitoxin system HicB family antitoxin [bacterium]|nr:type II toxin-antitoxin system HicB family antitoxin [bacterium]